MIQLTTSASTLTKLVTEQVRFQMKLVLRQQLPTPQTNSTNTQALLIRQIAQHMTPMGI